MDDDFEIIIPEIKPLNSGFRWMDEKTDKPPQKTEEESSPVVKKLLLAAVIIILSVILLMPDSSSSSTQSFVEAFPPQKVKGKYNEEVANQIKVATVADASGDKKIALVEIDKLIEQVKENLSAKGKNNDEISRDSLYQFCLKKRKNYK